LRFILHKDHAFSALVEATSVGWREGIDWLLEFAVPDQYFANISWKLIENAMVTNDVKTLADILLRFKAHNIALEDNIWHKVIDAHNRCNKKLPLPVRIGAVLEVFFNLKTSSHKNLNFRCKNIKVNTYICHIWMHCNLAQVIDSMQI
jgi:hypothetical protein